MALYPPDVERLFLALADSSAEEQRRSLADVPPDVRNQVETLLHLDASASSVLPTEGVSLRRNRDRVPDRIAHFTIVRLVGQGSMGTVYAAQQAHPKRIVALKLIAGAVNERALELFRSEAQALANVHHPAVPEVYETGIDDGRPWISMEYVAGRPLSAWLESGPTWEERLQMLTSLTDALSAAHQANVLHRDLKPANILVGPDGPHLVDFGIAAIEGADFLRAGTPAYMSPEALAGGEVDVRSDLFSLARVGQDMLDAEGDLAHTLARALSENPNERHPSVADFAVDLRLVGAHRPLPWRRDPLQNVTLWIHRNKRLVVAVAIALAVASSTLLWGMVRNQQQSQAAHQQLVRLKHVVAKATAHGDFVAAEELVQAFVATPTYSVAAAQALVWWGQTLEESGRDGRDQYAQAWLRSDDTTEVELSLAHALLADSDWDGLWALRKHAGRHPQLQPTWVKAAEAKRDFSLSSGAFANQARTAEALGLHPWRAAWVDAGLVQIQRETIEMVDGTKVQTPHPNGWKDRDNFAVVDGSIWLATGDGQSNAQVNRWSNGQWVRVATLPVGAVQSVVPGNDGLYVALSYPDRGLWHVDRKGKSTQPHPPTNTLDVDVLDVELADLTGDGQQELLIALGPWDGYALRVLQRADEGWVVHSDTPIGMVSDLAILPGDPMLVLAGKVDVELDPRTFGTETPYGPEAGVYVFESHSEGLQQVAFWPLPIVDTPATSSAQALANPLVGDFDGDGHVDVAWTLSRMSTNIEGHLWFLSDVRRAIARQEPPEAHVIWGLTGHDVADQDGDGDVELLVDVHEHGLYVWGSGDTALPSWASQATPTPPRDAPTAAVEDLWSRATDLMGLGLPLQASNALTLAPAVVADPGVQHQALAWAGRISHDAGELEMARDHLRAALVLQHDPEVAVELQRVLLDLHDLEAAREVDAPAAPWMDAPLANLWTSGAKGWTVERSGVFYGDGIIVYNDQGTVARRTVEVVSPWVQLDMEVQLDGLELGAGVAVELHREGEALLSVAFWGQGGGQTVKVYQQCGDAVLEHIQVVGLQPGTTPLLSMSTARVAVDTPPTMRCSTHFGGVNKRIHVQRDALALGPAELVIRAHGHPTYQTPSSAKMTVHSLRSTGLQITETPRSSHALARHALLEGDASGDPPPGEEAWWALARGAGLQEALDAADEQTVSWLLRTEDPDVMQSLFGREDFPALFEKTFMPLIREPDGHRIALLPPLTALPLHDPAARRILSIRALAHFEKGARASARILAVRLAAVDARENAVADAAVLLARLDSERMWEHLARAVETSPAPASMLRRVRLLPELHPLRDSPERARALLQGF